MTTNVTPTERLHRYLLYTALTLLALDVSARITGNGSVAHLLAQASVVVSNTVTVQVDDASVEDPLGELAGAITGAVLDVNVKQLGGTATPAADACAANAKTTDPVSLNADGVLVTKHATKKNFVCSLFLVVAGAETINLIEGDGTNCGTNRAAFGGSTTAANGMSFGANGGFIAVGGSQDIILGKTANRDLCLDVSTGGVRVSGFVTWAQQ